DGEDVGAQLRWVAVLRRPRRQGPGGPRQREHLPDHRLRDEGHGDRRCHLPGRRRPGKSGEPDRDGQGHDRPAVDRRRQPERRTPMTSITIATEKGDIDVDLFTSDAPKATKNFMDLAKKGFYDDVVFHRVIPGFVIQAGDGQHGKKSSLNAGRVGTGGPGYTFEDEPVKGDYVRGALAMAN